MRTQRKDDHWRTKERPWKNSKLLIPWSRTSHLQIQSQLLILICAAFLLSISFISISNFIVFFMFSLHLFFSSFPSCSWESFSLSTLHFCCCCCCFGVYLFERQSAGRRKTAGFLFKWLQQSGLVQAEAGGWSSI